MADWDRFSEDYDRIFLENPQYLEAIDMILSRVDAPPGSVILDLGCGTGNVSARALELAGTGGSIGEDVKLVGVDPSPGMRDKCRARFAGVPAFEVREGDSLDIPAEDREFGVAVSNLALHHVPPADRGRCASEICRVLKPEGLLVYADMFCDVDSDAKDPVRVKDIVDKMVGAAMYCLDHGAYDMMNVMLSALPDDITGEGEYLTTPDVWSGELERAGFVDPEVAEVPPEEFGVKIIVARKRGR